MDVNVTIITPVYNREHLVVTTIRSVLNQTYCNFELLLIDDGSTDGSLEMCKTYEKKDSRIRVFHKENGGVSSARNLGLRFSKGKYITFLDSDDTIEPDFFEKILATIKKFDADIVFSNANNPGKTITSDFVLNDSMQIKKSISDFYYLVPSNNLAGNLYKKELILHGFDEGQKISEDFLFNLQYLAKSKKIVYSPIVGYISPDIPRVSITRNFVENEFEMYVNSQKALIDFVGREHISADLENRLFGIANSSIVRIIENNELNIRSKRELINLVIENKFFQDNLKFIKPKNFRQRVLKILYKYRMSKIIYEIFKKNDER